MVQGLADSAVESQRSVGKQIRFTDAAKSIPKNKDFHAAALSGLRPDTLKGTPAEWYGVSREWLTKHKGQRETFLRFADAVKKTPNHEVLLAGKKRKQL